MSKVAIYVRVSTAIQAEEGYSISQQLEKLTSYCTIKDWAIYDTYTDAGFSGGNTERPAMEKLISDAKRKRFDTVLVYKLDRLSRSVKDTLYLVKDVFTKNNISFVSLQENIDTSSAMGNLFLTLLSAIAEFEREQIKERMMLGRVGRAKSGKPSMFGGDIAFGYEYDKLKDELIINQGDAIIVKRIFSEYLSGKSIVKIMTQLNQDGLLRRGKKWYYQSINRILKNPVYVGKVKFADEVYDGNHQAIIDDKTYYAVQGELKRRQLETAKMTNNPRPFRAKYILSGITKCGYCQAPLQILVGAKRKDGSKPMRYQCVNRYPKTSALPVYNENKKCDSKCYEKEDLEEYILNQIRDLQSDKSKLDELFETHDEIDVKAIERQIAALDNKMKKLNDLYLNDMIDLEDLKQQTEAFKSKKAMLEKELIDNPAILQQKSKARFENLLNINDVLTLDYETQKKLVNDLISQVFVKAGLIEIYWKI